MSTATYLSGTGTVIYNGYALQGPRNSVQLEIVPVRDSTDRHVTHSLFRFSIDAWLTYDQLGGYASSHLGADDHLKKIRGLLSRDGKALTISGFGFGDVQINTTAQNRDINFGPKTKILKMRSISNSCVVLTWVVEAAVKTCGDTGVIISNVGSVREFVYGVQWSIKPNGCTVRRVSGHVSIALNTDLNGDGVLDYTADSFRHLIQVPLIPGFMRSDDQVYQLNERKDKLSFQITDHERESDNAYPPGVSDIDFQHNITSEFGSGNFTIQTGTFSGRIAMAKPYPVSLAWEKALLLMMERLQHSRNAGASPWVTYVSITESVFTRSISFTVRYQLRQSSLNKMVQNSALFTKFRSVSDATHEQSMKISRSDRGLASLIHDPKSERFPDLCNGTLDQPWTIRDKTLKRFLEGAIGTLLTDCPKKADSYMVYDNVIDFTTEATTTIIEQMPMAPDGKPPGQISYYDGVPITGGNPREDRKQVVQTHGDKSPKLFVTVRGRAYRIGYEPEIPKVITVMRRSAKITQNGSNYSITQVGTYGKCPVYAAQWSNTYVVEVADIQELNNIMKGGLSSVILDTIQSDDEEVNAWKKGGM